MNIKKAGKIIKAYIDELPEGEDWYEDRMKECRSCEYNTKNMDPSEVDLKHKVKLKTGVCSLEGVCTACGCCVDLKSSVKSETCGLKEIGKTPKWIATEYENDDDKNLKVENMFPKDVSMVYSGGKYLSTVYTDKNKVSFKIKIHRKGGFNYLDSKSSCSCTDSQSEKIDDNNFMYNVDISTTSFKKGLNNRSTSIRYYVGKKVKEIQFKFQINKK